MELAPEEGQLKAVGYIKTGCLDLAAAILQRKLILGYAKEHDLEIVDIYEDTGLIEQGRKCLLANAAKGHFKVVITDKPRNFLEKNEYLQLFAQGISLYFTRPAEGLVPLAVQKTGRRAKKKQKVSWLKNQGQAVCAKS